MTRFKPTLILAILMCGFAPVFAQQWASLQIDLRNKVRDQMYLVIDKWQIYDGGIFQTLDRSKWDDETEKFLKWPAFYLLTGDEKIYQSIKGAAFKYISRATQAKLFNHGYYKTTNSYTLDTEHTMEGVGILGELAFVKPGEQEVVRALEDIVEHAGNFVPGYAPWFNVTTKHMRSLRPGTLTLSTGCVLGVDWIFNLAFAKMAMADYYATKDERYLNWVRDYLDGWIASIEKNETENGFYLIPWEIDPSTDQIGPCSHVWYCPSTPRAEWGWQEGGAEKVRDMRGAFLDYYRFTHDVKYLDVIKKQMRFLFSKGSNGDPASIYVPAQNPEPEKWVAGSEDGVAQLAVQASLVDTRADPAFDELLAHWYYSNQNLNFWRYRKFGGVSKMVSLLTSQLGEARDVMTQLNNLTHLPATADSFPEVAGMKGLTFSAFGGLLNAREEMPWAEVLYFHDDGSLGLDENVAALVELADETSRVVSLCNLNKEPKYVKLQAGFLPQTIEKIKVNNGADEIVNARLARVLVPAGATVRVELDLLEGYVLPDTTPPNPPQGLYVVPPEPKTSGGS
jgi:hypothetical protein